MRCGNNISSRRISTASARPTPRARYTAGCRSSRCSPATRPDEPHSPRPGMAPAAQPLLVLQAGKRLGWARRLRQCGRGGILGTDRLPSPRRSPVVRSLFGLVLAQDPRSPFLSPGIIVAAVVTVLVIVLAIGWALFRTKSGESPDSDPNQASPPTLSQNGTEDTARGSNRTRRAGLGGFLGALVGGGAGLAYAGPTRLPGGFPRWS
jgi:hypothetical protein